MIYTVFPINGGQFGQLPQDFSSMDEAKAYAEWLAGDGYDSVIESTDGEVV